MKLLTKTTLSLRPKNDFSRVRAFSWFPAELQSLLIWWLKFSLSAIWTPRSLTADGVDLIFSFPILSSILSHVCQEELLETCQDLQLFCYYEAN